MRRIHMNLTLALVAGVMSVAAAMSVITSPIFGMIGGIIDGLLVAIFGSGWAFIPILELLPLFITYGIYCVAIGLMLFFLIKQESKRIREVPDNVEIQ